MYSIVLVMALGSGGDVTPTGHLFGHGCNGGGYSNGCGGGGHPLLGGHGSGHGCSGGGYSNSCGGGGGHPLFGGHGCAGGGHPLFGGHGCAGGGHHFLGGHGGEGCSGGHKMFSHFHRNHGCSGAAAADCCGSAPVTYGCVGGPPPVGSVPSTGGTAKPDAKMPEGVAPGTKVKPPQPEEVRLTAPATVIVSLPAEASLTIDGNLTQSTSSTRIFTSPALERGNDYFYTLKAEFLQDGKPVVTAKRITVRAGEGTRVAFDLPVASVAQR